MEAEEGEVQDGISCKVARSHHRNNKFTTGIKIVVFRRIPGEWEEQKGFFPLGHRWFILIPTYLLISHHFVSLRTATKS